MYGINKHYFKIGTYSNQKVRLVKNETEINEKLNDIIEMDLKSIDNFGIYFESLPKDFYFIDLILKFY